MAAHPQGPPQMTDPYPPQTRYMPPPAGPPKKKGHGCLWAALAVGGVILLLGVVLTVVGVANTSKTTTGSPVAVPSSTTTAPAEPGTTQAAPAPVGTTVSPAKDWFVTVNSAETNGNATAARANQFNRPQPGGQFVIVNLTVRNGSDKPNAALSQLKLTMLGPSGVASPQSFSCAQIATPFSQFAQLQPGASTTGNLCFEVPAAEAATSVLLAEPTITVDKVKDQRFLALT
jgi:invasion protein IalB